MHQYPDISYVPPRVKVSFPLHLFSLKPHPPMIQRPVAFCHSSLILIRPGARDFAPNPLKTSN
jgi:hypothetical protein